MLCVARAGGERRDARSGARGSTQPDEQAGLLRRVCSAPRRRRLGAAARAANSCRWICAAARAALRRRSAGGPAQGSASRTRAARPSAAAAVTDSTGTSHGAAHAHTRAAQPNALKLRLPVSSSSRSLTSPECLSCSQHRCRRARRSPQPPSHVTAENSGGGIASFRSHAAGTVTRRRGEDDGAARHPRAGSFPARFWGSPANCRSSAV